ncbi:MAG: DUF5615 family PIN-like protein [Acidobacteriota bacterium]|nr:DUF5615 family PIN-like protein [Acidobacteriota bacterium]
MIVLLDENFPLGLLHSLENDGLSVQHIITLGWRGASDARIRERLQDDQVVFLTQDEDFLVGETSRAIVVLSRVRQSRPLKDRIEIWRSCLRELLQSSKSERLYKLMDNGALLPWRDTSSDT